MIHSAPLRLTSAPFQTPAGIAYTPQWMNIPKRASRHHFIRRSWEAPKACTHSGGGGASTVAESATAFSTDPSAPAAPGCPPAAGAAGGLARPASAANAAGARIEIIRAAVRVV